MAPAVVAVAAAAVKVADAVEEEAKEVLTPPTELTAILAINPLCR